jgi:bile acid-coenzyme A ligase
MHMPLAALPRYEASRKGEDVVALSLSHHDLSWGGLEYKANQRAHQFKKAGVKPGDPVVIGVGTSLEFFEISFAIWKVGAWACPMSPSMTATEMAATLELLQPSLIVADEGDWPVGITRLPARVSLLEFDGGSFAEAEPFKFWKAILSGGSTGRPKIIVDHSPALFDTDMVKTQALEQRLDEVTLITSPLHHNLGFAVAHAGLMLGNRVILTPRFDARETVRLIEHYNVNVMALVPTMMHRIWNEVKHDPGQHTFPSLRAMYHGAAATPQWLKHCWLDWLGPERVWELYGSTEFRLVSFVGGHAWKARPGSVGKVGLSYDVRVLREDGSDCEPGEVGEIAFKNEPGVSPSYHYIGSEPREAQGGWQLSGDLGWLDEDGYLFIADRRVDMIIRGGVNIFPTEIEAAIDRFPGVETSVVLGLENDELGQQVHAIVHACDESIDLQALHAHLGKVLSRHKLPRTYELTFTSLRDEAGKVRRIDLRADRERKLRDGTFYAQSISIPA